MRNIFKKTFVIAIAALSFCQINAVPGIGAVGDNGVPRGAGRVVEGQSGKNSLLDLVTDGTCEWKKGRVVAKRFPLFYSKVLKTIQSGNPEAFAHFLLESDKLNVCLTKGNLRPLTEDEKKEVTVYYIGTKQGAIRHNDEVYIDVKLLDTLNDYHQAHLWLHELTHSYIEMDTFARTMKLMSFVRSVSDHVNTGFSPEEFNYMAESNGLKFPSTGLMESSVKDAVRTGKYEDITYFLDSGTDSEMVLRSTIEQNELRAFQIAMTYRPNLNPAQWSPLESAAAVGSTEMLNALLEAGAKINQGRILLHAALSKSPHSIFSIVLSHPEVNLEKQGVTESLLLLIRGKNGRLFEKRREYWYVGFDYSKENYTWFREIPDEWKFEQYSASAFQSLQEILKNKRAIPLVNRVVDMGLGENYRDYYYSPRSIRDIHWTRRNLSPLSFAAAIGDYETVALLINSGADINLSSPGESSPFELSLKSDIVSTHKEARTLVANLLASTPGFNPNQKTTDGDSFLNLAIKNGMDGLVEKLLKMPGIDVSFTPKDGQSPLFAACHQRKKEWVARLLELGADPNGELSGQNCMVKALRTVRDIELSAYDSIGYYGFDRYSDKQKAEIKARAEAIRAEYDQILSLMVANPRYDVITKRRLSDISLHDESGNALHFAIIGGLPKTVAALIQRKDVNAAAPDWISRKDGKGWTAMDIVLNTWGAFKKKEMLLILANAPGIDATAALSRSEVYCDPELRAAYIKAGGFVGRWRAPMCR